MAGQRKRAKQNDLSRELARAGALCLAFVNTGAPTRDARRNNPRVQPAAWTYPDLVAWA